jgi:hypothetical protein
MLETSFPLDLRERGVGPTRTLQQAYSSVHCAPAVSYYRSNTFGGRRIGRRSDISWPPHSPELTTCDNSLWSILKEKTSKLWLTDIKDQKQTLRTVIMVLGLQNVRKYRKEHGNCSNNVRRIKGNVPICCNFTAEELRGHSVRVKIENFITSEILESILDIMGSTCFLDLFYT